MKIIQITDQHIGKEKEDTYGVDVRQNFLDVLDTAKARQPDYLVLTGDFCYLNSEIEVYKWVKLHLDLLNIPYNIISGNHDNSKELAKIFQVEDSLVEE